MIEKAKQSIQVKGWRMIAAWLGIPALGIALQSIGWLAPESLFLFVAFGLVGSLFLLFRKASFRVGISLVLCFSYLSLWQPEALHELLTGLNYRMRDFFFVMRGPQKPTGEVVVVDLDQKSLDAMGQWPWPRTEVAAVIRNLLDDGAKVVGFDIVFAEADRLSLGAWVKRIERLGAEVALPERIDPAALRTLVMLEWEERLQEKNPTFSAESEELLVDEYLRQREEKWIDEQALYRDRMEASGRHYEVPSYAPPADPLLEMAQLSRELGYLTEEGEVVADNDRELAEAFFDSRVVAGGLFITPTSAGARVAQVTAEESRREMPGMVLETTIEGADEVFWGMRTAIEQVINHPQVQQGARHQGMFNIVPDRAGSARYYTMLMRAPVYQETLVLKEGMEDATGFALLDPDNYEAKIITQHYVYPSISLEMLRTANGYRSVAGVIQDGYSGVRLSGSESSPDRFIPLDHKADININFRGFGGAWQPEYEGEKDEYFPYVSMSDVATNGFPKGTFSGKMVLIGSTDATLSDLVGSPFRPAFPGLEVHATMLDNLIKEDFFVEDMEKNNLLTFLGVLIGGTLLAIVGAYAGAWVSALLLAGVVIGLPLCGYWFFAYQQVIFDFVYPLFALTVIAISELLVNYFVEGRERRFVTGQFSKMVSPEVLKKIQEDPSATSLKGQKAEISVLFSDLQGFTTISEALEPEQLVNLLNDYLTPMTNVILEKRGFVDKYMGDAIMAVWGVPFPDDNHEVRACESALEQQAKIRELAPVWKEKYGVDVLARIGIGSGVASAAMMGSELRKSFTVMGDVVNLGARLEPACKDYGIHILICEKTYQAAKDHIEARCVDKLVVKGKSVPVPVYELMGLKGAVPEATKKKIDLFEKALKTHWERDWDGALSALRDLEGVDPEDGPAHNLQARIKDYQTTPPSESWQGEFVKTSK